MVTLIMGTGASCQGVRVPYPHGFVQAAPWGHSTAVAPPPVWQVTMPWGTGVGLWDETLFLSLQPELGCSGDTQSKATIQGRPM